MKGVGVLGKFLAADSACGDMASGESRGTSEPFRSWEKETYALRRLNLAPCLHTGTRLCHWRLG